MSTALPYDPALFVLERAEQVSARLGELILGESALGTTVSAWVPIESATFTLSNGYTADDNGTLIVEAETASVSLSFWGDPGDVPLYPSDQVRATYGGAVLFLGTVDTTDVTYAVDGAARRRGATHRVTFSASVAGTYAVALGRTVCWEDLPEEPAIDRVRRWVTVNGW
jgi:hypothetical protein